MRSRSALKALAGAGVLAVVVAGTGAVVVAEMSDRGDAITGSDTGTPTGGAAQTTVTADVPVLNPNLGDDDLAHVTPASRGTERTALADGVTLTVVVDGETREITTAAATLADALAEAGVQLGWDDEVSADLAARPEQGSEVTIARVVTQYVAEEVAAPAPVEQRETDDLPLGETRVVQEGVDGSALVTSEVRLVDGVEVSRAPVLQARTVQPVSEVVEVGTRETPTSARLYTLREFMSAGVVNWDGYRFTYYSQAVLPGGGLAIPGRHVNADGYVSDGDGYIVLANSSPRGTVIDTPFGYQGKVYDRGTVGNHYDVYTQ